MTDIKYIDAIMHGHFLYWDTLGNLRGIENHKEDGLRWLSGDVYWNYFTDTSDADIIIQRMKNKEIPNNLMLFANSPEDAASEPFTATGLFKENTSHYMAHNLMDTSIPKPDKRLNIFHVREISQLKMAGAILNAAFEYDLFTFGHYLELMENNINVFYLAEYNGLPVGAVMAQHGDNFINVSWVGTLPGYRKRGIAGHLIQTAECDGIQCGKTIGVLHSGPESAGAYRRIGYREYCRGIDLHLIE
jgi:GNAT superfamily N-acetyltransferase